MARILSGEEQYRHMMETPIPRLVTTLAIPTTISMLITVIYNTADTYFVAQINESASGAVGMVYTLMAVLQAIGYGFGMGAGSLISRCLGARDQDSAARYAASAFFATMVVGAAAGWGGLCFLRPILNFLRCTDSMMTYAVDYAFYILLAAPITCASFVLNNILRAEGEAQVAMWGMGIGGLLNVLLDPLLIFGLNMGTAGAALATIISQTVGFLILLSVFLCGKSIVPIRFGNISRRLKDYGMIIATGFPTICRQGLGSLAAALLNMQAVVYGDAAVSAITIANKAYILVRNIILGIGQGFQPVAGYNFSAGNRKRTWQAFCFTSLVGTAVCVISAIAIAFFSGTIMAWFHSTDEVARIGEETMGYACLVMPFMAVSTYVNQLYQCLGFKAAATLLAACRQGIFFIPAVLILPRFMQCAGVQISQPAADLMTFAVSVPFLIVFYKKHIVMREEIL